MTQKPVTPCPSTVLLRIFRLPRPNCNKRLQLWRIAPLQKDLCNDFSMHKTFDFIIKVVKAILLMCSVRRTTLQSEIFPLAKTNPMGQNLRMQPI